MNNKNNINELLDSAGGLLSAIAGLLFFTGVFDGWNSNTKSKVIDMGENKVRTKDVIKSAPCFGELSLIFGIVGIVVILPFLVSPVSLFVAMFSPFGIPGLIVGINGIIKCDKRGLSIAGTCVSAMALLMYMLLWLIAILACI